MYHDINFKNAVAIENKLSEISRKVSIRQCDIMFFIEELELNTLSLISKELDLSLASLSIIISKMVNNNLITKNYHEDEQDGRIVVLQLTDEGKKFYYEIKEIIVLAIVSFLKSLDDNKYDIFKNAVRELEFIGNLVGATKLDLNQPFESQSEVIYKSLLRMKFICEKIFRSINSEVDSYIYEKGLKILTAVLKHDLHTPSEIAKKTKTTESTISTQLKSLIKKNVVYKEKKSGDSRKTYFYATNEGIDIYNRCLYSAMELLSTTIDKLDDDLKKNLDKGLDNIIILFELLLK